MSLLRIMKHMYERLSAINIDESELGIPTADPDAGSIEAMLRIFFGVVAGVAVLIITLAAMYFALSRGNPEKSARARNAIIYAAVGLAVAVLAIGIVELVIGRAA